MSSTNKTTYYELPQYVDNDIFNPLQDDNDAYEIIDTALHNIANAEADDASEIVGVKSRLDSAEDDIDALKAQNGNSVLTTTAPTLSGAVNELDSDVNALNDRMDNVEDDINNASTGLKAKVDDLGTRMASAEGDIDALEAQNGNSVLKTEAQTLTGAINENFDKIATYDTIYTPEMFGAVGDGVADDTVAVQSALSAGKCCVLNKTYKTTAPISISSHDFVILNGTINYTGNDCAIVLSSDPHIVGTGIVNSAGSSVIANNNLPLRFAVVEGIQLNCTTSGAKLIKLTSNSSDNSVSNNRFVRVRLDDGGDADNPVADAGIYIESTLTGYINENRFEQIKIWGCDFGIEMVIGGENNMNRNQFVEFTTEDCAHSLYANKTETGNGAFYDCIFDFRTLEFRDRTELIQIVPVMHRCIFYGEYAPYMFKSLVTTAPSSIYAVGNQNSNLIIGRLMYNNHEYFTAVAEFVAYGSQVFFDFKNPNQSSNTAGTDGVLTLDYSGTHNRSAGYNNYRIADSATSLTIDLNNCSNMYYCPIKHLNIQNNSGTDITIVNGTQTIMAQTHLAKGIHELMFTAGDTMVVLY